MLHSNEKFLRALHLSNLKLDQIRKKEADKYIYSVL